MKRFLCALLTLCLLAGGGEALALTGEEALGLTDSGSASSGSGLSATYPTLRVGSRDGDDSAAYVVMLQNRLQELGYLTSAADGQFGSMTESAVMLFQEVNALTPTGVADDSTQSILYSASALPAPATAVVDSDVLRVQQALLRWGFMTGTADGVTGDATEKGVAEFKNYIYISNRVAYAAYATPKPMPAVTPTPPPGQQPIVLDVELTTSMRLYGQNGEITEDVVKFADGEYVFQIFQSAVQQGSTGPEVWRVQRRLCQLKYLYKPDGEFGSLTERALKYFQKKHGLPETGIADRATQETLFSDAAEASEEYVFPYKIFVSLDEQRVYIYEWDGSGYNKELAKDKCSTGMKGSETPMGTYQAAGKVNLDEWYYFEDYNCYAKYAYRIVGGVMFHSVLYNAYKQGPTSTSVRALGRAVSHGCVRLSEQSAKWIWENCPEGTTVVVR